MVTRRQKRKPILGKLDKNHKNIVATTTFNIKQPFCFLEQSVQTESVATNELTMNFGVRVRLGPARHKRVFFFFLLSFLLSSLLIYCILCL